MLDCVIVIPARYDSTRLKGKPLLNKTGKYLIQHVWEGAIKARSVDKFIIATADQIIKDACDRFGAECIITSRYHESGTSRVAEVAKKINCRKIINLQCDEPEIEPAVIDKISKALENDEMATAAANFAVKKDILDPNRVKVVSDKNGYAVCFTRGCIPDALLHIGIYGYTKNFLMRLIKLQPTLLEKTEKLEQLRVLENGYKIKVIRIDKKLYGGIDTMYDYRRFVASLK